MSRILLADDSPHAQRMGERILRDEGHEVITVSDGLVAMLRLKDAQPDIVIADISMPEVSGYELCEYIKNNGGAPVFLTAGAVEPVDEAEIARVRADGVLKKPFEASLLLEAVGRVTRATGKAPREAPKTAGPPRSVVVLDPDQVRAAVTVALDSAMPALVDEISAKVLAALAGGGRGPGQGKAGA
ncbi:MAG TPA: response regulator [Bryobacteraceae bacterium]|nr:response regulator [Bryobacteraceae bacterium]